MAADAAGAAAPEGEMAQNGQDVFFRQWLEVYGQEEYALYRKDAGAECLSYEDWTLSQHALGPYLYRLTIDAWDLVSSDPSDDDDVEATSAQPAASKPTATAVKKTRLTLLNGKNGKSTKSSSSQTEAGDAATNEVADNGEPVHSAKKRRKRRKNNQAQPIVPPLDNEQPSTPSAAADVRDGVEGGVSTEKKKRKGGRKPKSAVTPGQHATEVTEVLESTPGPDTSATTSATQAARASTTSTPLAAAGDASPTSAARRGLRTRTPAQQRPYWHHNKVFEEIDDSSVKPSSTIKSKLGTVSYADDDDDDEEEETLDVDDNDSDVEMVAVEQSPPRTTPRKFKGKGRAWKKEGEDEDGDYRVASSVKKALQQPPEPAPVDQPPPKKKRGRPRKSLPNPLTKDLLAASPQSQPQSAQGTRGGGTPDVFSLYSAADLRTASDLDSPANPPPTAGDEQTEQTKGYRQRRPRRPHKSEEFVREDDSDLDSDNDLLTSKDSRRPNPDDRGPNLTGKPRLVVTLKTCIRPRASSEPPPTQTALSGGDLFTRPKPPRRPRMRKSFLSQEFVGADDSDLEDGGGDGEGKGVNGVMERQPTPVKRRRNRKSHLSEEFVRDESSDDEEMGEGDTTLGSETPAPAAGRDADGDVRMVNGDEDHDDGLVSPKQTFATPKRKSTAMNDGNGNTHSPAASAKPASTKKGKPAQQPMKFTPRKGYTASGKKIGRPPKNRQSGALATNTTPRSSAKSSVPDLESSAPAADSPSAKSSSTLTPSRRGRPKRVNIVDDTEI